ncbi:unnamed protein product [Didymodactylos carnosus]|uniref:Uncharacterized protein n=1 Tax=Didymodactylos carnosus TaxID=1234261 RepID=A0A8S2I3N2_9BILA|nr:unnamed protein product [Didymodactylos carnosus]CAF3694179.1 unnamed protein product [Didymodactylos carnosus]
MQAVLPVHVHVENEWQDEGKSDRRHTPRTRMRTCVTNKTKTKSSVTIVPKQTQKTRSRSPSPSREPWIPPPGRTTKGQRFAWQSPKSRLEINPVTEITINDDTDNEDYQESERPQRTTSASRVSAEQQEQLATEIKTYEKRIQTLIENIGMLKEKAQLKGNQSQADNLRSEIGSSLVELEQLQKQYAQRVASMQSQTTTVPSYSSNSVAPFDNVNQETTEPFSNRTNRVTRSRSSSQSPIRTKSPLNTNNNNTQQSRSWSADQKRRLTPKVSFEDTENFSRKSTTPTRGPLRLNPERERLLVALSASETDIAAIIAQLSSLKDILTKLKVDDQPVSYEIDQLYKQRNQLLNFIEQFEKSNSSLKDFLQHQYHLEAEHGHLHEEKESLLTRLHYVENENRQIRRLLLDRENDNISLNQDLDKLHSHTIGFDTIKTSLETNRAHLQRELHAKEGDINRLQCQLRMLERDLHKNRSQCENLQRSIEKKNDLRKPMFSGVNRRRVINTEKLQTQLNEKDEYIEKLEKQLIDLKSGGKVHEKLINAETEITRLQTKLEHSERLMKDYKEQLNTSTSKIERNNLTKNHLSEMELEKRRVILQKRIEELEPLPELLRQAEFKNQELQTKLIECEKRINEQTSYINELTSKHSVQYRLLDRMKEKTYSSDDDNRTLQQKIDLLERQLCASEEENTNIHRNLNIKDETVRDLQARLNSKTFELSSITKQFDNTQNDIKAKEVEIRDTFGSKERMLQQRVHDLDNQLSKLRLEFGQLKREKEELERRNTLQLSDLRDKLEQSHNTNRSMQNYVNFLKTTYSSVFNDSLNTFPSTVRLNTILDTPITFP